MGELVRFELENLKRRDPLESIDSRVKELLSRITMARNCQPMSVGNLLQGLIDLYDDQDWATPVIREAKRQLAELDQDGG